MTLKARAEIVCVGTELLSGKLNTHTAHLCRLLRGAGLEARRETTVVDSVEEIRDAVAAAAVRSVVVLVCGGLGPTFDDITREGVAAAVGRPLVFRPRLAERIRRLYLRYRLRIPPNNKRQAWVLRGARVLDNRNGSAPGQFLDLPADWRPGPGTKTSSGARPARRRRSVVLLPGPFEELGPIFEGDVLPVLRGRHGTGRATRQRVFRFCGIAEAAADRRLAPLLKAAGPGIEPVILARPGLVELQVSSTARTIREAEGRLDRLGRRIARRMGGHLYGRDRDTLESVLGARLRELGWTLATAESCTGGLVAQRVTSVPGSSGYYRGSVVAYRDDLKAGLLGVREGTIRRFGAVSGQCAREMALGVCARCGAGVGIAITGIAGPGGRTPKKPVGLTFIGISTPDRTLVRRFLFPGTRAQVRERAATTALHALLAILPVSRRTIEKRK
ncbi:MAG: nicotinamide-nucleotide amidohydrolase family protein [Elusimicrobiota bacterium]